MIWVIINIFRKSAEMFIEVSFYWINKHPRIFKNNFMNLLIFEDVGAVDTYRKKFIIFYVNLHIKELLPVNLT